MLVHALNLALKARNGSKIVPLRWMHVFSLPLGDRVLTYRIVHAWCIERPSSGLSGDYPNLIAAFVAAWRIEL